MIFVLLGASASAEEKLRGIDGGLNVDLPILTLTVGGGVVRAELAATPESRRVGLSGRRTLALDGGMLLMLPRVANMCLWMHKVYFPLDAAFIDTSGVVVSTARMLAHTEDLHCPPLPICYALEVSAGWLDKHQVTAGMRLAGFALHTEAGINQKESPPRCGGGLGVVAE